MDRREFVKKIGLVSVTLGLNEEKESEDKSCDNCCRRWELKSGDVIVIECPYYIHPVAYESISKKMTKVFPENDIVILQGNNKLKILSKET